MAVDIPTWIRERGGDLKESKDTNSYLLYFAGQLQYLIMPVPADGKFACRLTQTINGKRLDGTTTYPTKEASVAGGLEELRAKLGW